MTTKAAQILVVIPHPDDAEFGAAGTVARWIRKGKEVVYVVCTNGDKGTSDPEMTSARLAKIREKEQRAAAKVLGVREVVFLRYPDQRLEDTPKFRKDIVRAIRQFKPDTVVTCDPYKRYTTHRDHRITGQVTLDAVYPTARDLLAFPDLIEQGLLPHAVKEVFLWGSDEPNYPSDITDTFELKIAALLYHKSQFGNRPTLEIVERVKQWSKMSVKGKDYELAEAFYRFESFR
ncbi:MAG: PIG-L domain-containing protein [Dehalococcoidales bacterium]|jgi:LmbE family N-acetylglucosaminyl deacetylase|nr:PIG-L domain-containing protein [Dehalococcoidales bacterium]MDP6221476.1 PIG-L deacetylase family protein [Dehalococcoidales bacterium]MDP7109791.1 PIG-L deacetylase family protein [Dehalococcoidales bacterium]MDP7310376.1 PIG-L deacetylase family protein [Dehalococcoidales bacterium]MDP7410102.1 PIG-L deacetylase family protein [Dehalococcoidales bacterium]|tara:strand:- start:418 stop:1116 length:699 start_codon:yes stop_codon:yes gene_type:complete